MPKSARLKDTAAERPRPALPRIAHFLFTGSLAAAALVLLVVGVTLWQARQDAWERAENAAENLLHGVVGHIDQHMRLYTFALDLAEGAFSDAEAALLSDGAKHRMLASIAARADYVGSMLVLDANGNILLDSGSDIPRSANFADRDYFWMQRDNPHLGLYVSQPYRSRLRGGDPSIALSRRLNNADGSFAGVILIAIRLAYIDAFFATLDMGRRGSLLLLSTDGRILTRQPSTDAQGDSGTDLSKSENFRRMRAEVSGSFVGTASDGVERFYTFARVPNQPLIVDVALSTQDIFEDWWWRSTVIGAITLLVCLAMVALAIMLRRELLRRAIAEADLAFLSVTDGLTGLANRRRFDEVIQREWRRTGRTGASLALLMIDVDGFKELNDKYGHARGDEVLKALARVIDQSIRRPGDLGARYGGEEFAVVLPDTDHNAALGIAETIRARSCESVGLDLPKFTVSIGVKSLRPSQDQSVSQLLEAADRALYRAKDQGRNRVVLAA